MLKPSGFIRSRKTPTRRREGRLHLQDFVGVEFVQFALVRVGRNQQMAVVVRKAVEHHDALGAAPGDQIGAIVLLRQAPADKTRIVSARRLGACDVGQAPGGPEAVHACDLSC